MENEEHDEYLRVVNKTFRSEWEGYEFYYKYVKIKGFGVRKEEVKYLSGTRTRFRRRYMCFKEVNHTLANFERPDPKRTPKALTRCGCLARFDIEMSATTSEWFVKDFVDNHNHPLTKAMLLTMEHAAGGPERVGFISWDLYNFVAEYKKKKIEGRDAELQQKGNDADFYYRYDTIF